MWWKLVKAGDYKMQPHVKNFICEVNNSKITTKSLPGKGLLWDIILSLGLTIIS